MNNFFNLTEYCYIVDGKEGSLLYDLKNKRVFSFDEVNREILRYIDNGESISRIKEINDERIVDKLLNDLFNNGLGTYSEKKYFKEKYRVGKKKKLLSEIVRDMNTAFIELPSSCTQNCTHCKDNKYSVCETCTASSVISKDVDINFYKEIISEITKLNFKTIVFHGGDPLTLGEELNLLIQYTTEVKSKDTKILLKTNGSLLNNMSIKELIKNKVQPIIIFDCTCYSKEKIQQKINNMENLLNEFRKHNINYYANLVLDKESEQYIDEIYKIFNQYKFIRISKSLIVNHESIPNSLLKQEIYHIPVDSFEDFKSNNHCLNNNIAITADKKILPCPGLKEEFLVDLKKDNIFKCFEDEINIDRFWKLTLNNVEICSDCEFKYSCRDCRAVEKNLTGNILGKKICEKILVK